MTSSAAPSRPLWLIAAPALFLILWSAGFAIAKLGLQHAPPITLLALRYCLVLLLLLPVALALFAVHGFMLENGPTRPLGPLHYYPQGIGRALTYFARIALLLSVSLLVVMTTRVNDLARALDQKGLPPEISYLLTAPLNLVDGIADEAAAIRDSLQVRGLAARSGFWARARLLRAMLAPLVRGLILEAGTRAEALEARGFRALPHRTLLEPLTETRAEAHLRMAILLASAAQLLALLL